MKAAEPVTRILMDLMVPAGYVLFKIVKVLRGQVHHGPACASCMHMPARERTTGDEHETTARE